MFSCECILAAALLTTPVDGPLPADAETWAQHCRGELIALALDAQLADPREEEKLLVHASDLANHLRVLQDRFTDLAFAPLIEECARFPDRRTIDGFLAFNRAYARDLRERIELDNVQAEQLRGALAETDRLHQIWSVLRDARCYYDVPVRRRALQLLHELLGAEAFYLGRMPPYVPLWRFPVARSSGTR